MRSLELNPQKFDVELRCMEIEPDNVFGFMTVEFRFGDTAGTQSFSSKEMDRIGKWFLSAAKEVRKSKHAKAKG